MRKAKILLVLSLIFVVFTFSTKSIAIEPNTSVLVNNTLPKVYQLGELQQDFEELKTIINESHPKYFTNYQALNNLFTHQYELLKENTGELEFFRILTPIIAKLNCGHTRLRLSKEYQDILGTDGIFFPLGVRVINNRAYILYNCSSVSVPAGAEILDINGRTIQEIIRVFLDNLPVDGSNVSRKYYLINAQFSSLLYNFADISESFTITYLDLVDQKPRQITLPAVKATQSGNPNLNGLEIYPYSQTFEKDYAVLTIKSFSFYQDEARAKFKAFIDGFFARLSDQKITHLILDLRNNGGGDPYCSSYVFAHLSNTAHPYFAEDYWGYYDLALPIKPAKNNYSGKLYTLINGGCFSSTGHLCSLLKYYNIGVFIGDETGGSFVCTDGSRDLVLKNTRLRLRYSTKAYQTAVEGLMLGRGIMPDYEVLPTIQDYLSSRDVQKEYAVKLMK